MAKRYASFTTAGMHASLEQLQDGRVVTTQLDALDINRMARATVGTQEEGDVNLAEFIAYTERDDDPTPAGKIIIGIVTETASTSNFVGYDDLGIGYRLAEGEIVHDNAVVAEVSSGGLGDVVRVVLDTTDTPKVSFHFNGALQYEMEIPASMLNLDLHLGASLACTEAGEINLWMNSGRVDFEYPSAQEGWWERIGTVEPYYIATRDFTTDPNSADGSIRFKGVIAGGSATQVSEVVFWPYGTNTPRASTFELQVLDPDGVYDRLIGGAQRDELADIWVFDEGSDFSTATRLGRLVFDSCQVLSDIEKKLVLKDDLVLLERPLQTRFFRPDAGGQMAFRPWPLCEGAVFSIDPPQFDSQELLYALDSKGISNFGVVRDNGDALDAYVPDYYGVTGGQVLKLENDPFGVITLDISAIGTAYVGPDLTDKLDGDGDPITGDVVYGDIDGFARSNEPVYRPYYYEDGATHGVYFSGPTSSSPTLWISHPASLVNGAVYNCTIDIAECNASRCFLYLSSTSSLGGSFALFEFTSLDANSSVSITFTAPAGVTTIYFIWRYNITMGALGYTNFFLTGISLKGISAYSPLGAIGNPFTGTNNAVPNGWTGTNLVSDETNKPFLYQGYVARFVEYTGQYLPTLSVTGGILLELGKTYQVRVRLGPMAGNVGYGGVTSFCLSAVADETQAWATIQGPKSEIATYTFVHSPTADETDLYLIYKGTDNVEGAGVSLYSIEIIEMPAVSEGEFDDDSLDPLSLEYLMRRIIEVRSGLPSTYWEAADAAAIDTATGYRGSGYYTHDQVQRRVPLDQLLLGYTAAMFKDADGKLRVTRLLAPEDEPATWELRQSQMLSEFVPTNDEPSNLTNQMLARRNYRTLNESELVTDEDDVTVALRRKLGRGYRFQVSSGVGLAPGLEAADGAAAQETLLNDPSAAQTEIGRVCYIMSRSRRIYTVDVDLDDAPLVGSIGTIYYSRYGFDSGVNVQVFGVYSDHVNRTARLRVFALAPSELLGD